MTEDGVLAAGEGVRLSGCGCIRTRANGRRAALGAGGAVGMDVSSPGRVINRTGWAHSRYPLGHRTAVSGGAAAAGRLQASIRRAALLQLRNSSQAKEPLLG